MLRGSSARAKGRAAIAQMVVLLVSATLGALVDWAQRFRPRDLRRNVAE
jgi:hypothetical protein